MTVSLRRTLSLWQVSLSGGGVHLLHVNATNLIVALGLSAVMLAVASASRTSAKSSSPG